MNHMTDTFGTVMNDISNTMKGAYNCESTVIIPGSGTYGMEAVARQFATGKDVLVIRNGFFSYRWTQIFDMGSIPSSCNVVKGVPMDDEPTPAFGPPPLDQLVATILADKPATGKQPFSAPDVTSVRVSVTLLQTLCNLLQCLHRTSRPPPASSFLMITSVRLAVQCAATAASLFWMASHQGPNG
jgi:hypothetical protein